MAKKKKAAKAAKMSHSIKTVQRQRFVRGTDQVVIRVRRVGHTGRSWLEWAHRDDPHLTVAVAETELR